MHIQYNKLWKLLIDRNMSRRELREKTGLSYASMNKLAKNEVVSLLVLVRVCTALDCRIDDIADMWLDEN